VAACPYKKPPSPDFQETKAKFLRGTTLVGENSARLFCSASATTLSLR